MRRKRAEPTLQQWVRRRVAPRAHQPDGDCGVRLSRRIKRLEHTGDTDRASREGCRDAQIRRHVYQNFALVDGLVRLHASGKHRLPCRKMIM
eukprot:1913792-Pleurochrysis_carterae.AAC.1